MVSLSFLGRPTESSTSSSVKITTKMIKIPSLSETNGRSGGGPSGSQGDFDSFFHEGEAPRRGERTTMRSLEAPLTRDTAFLQRMEQLGMGGNRRPLPVTYRPPYR